MVKSTTIGSMSERLWLINVSVVSIEKARSAQNIGLWDIYSDFQQVPEVHIQQIKNNVV